MSSIKIITASAGSGKTTRLTELLRDALVRGEARPDAVVATTFTNKAAAELQERARQQLLAAGRTADAHRLGAARIGTVNAVCGKLVDEFAFELGLAPENDVIDDKVAVETLNRALASAVSSDIEQELADLQSRLEDFEWRDAVRRIVESARTNGIVAGELEQCATRSVETLAELFDDPVTDGSALDQRLAEALDAFIEAYDRGGDATKTTAKAVTRCRRATETLRRGDRLAWREWASLASLRVARASEDLVVGVHEAATAHDRHPALRQDLQRATQLVFSLAKRALETYQEQKRRWGVVDFVDQEVFALELLQRADIRERLAGEIDLVLVDEFQDTSPLQLAIFIELAKMAPLSVWVGDQKQAIFGFRGTDPALMNAVIEDLLAGTDAQPVDGTVEQIIEASEPETLSLSWRSRPELVRLTSGIFAGAFAAHGIPEGRVRLEPGLETEPEGLGPIVEHWPLRIPDRRKTTELCAATASGVRDLLHDEAAAVRDPLSGDARRARPGDIAVLCRTNAQCSRIANALEALGVRAEVPRVGLFTTPEGRVALAGLALWLDPRSRLAAAELARITEHPDREDEWLAAVLDNEEGNAFGELPSVRGVRQARDAAIDAGPVEAFDRVVAATGLRRLARRWGEDAARVANVDALRAHVVRYVQITNSQRLPETVAGLVRYLRQLGETTLVNKRTVEPQDQRAVRSEGDAVVVSTWHRAKGLEWPITVLFGLESIRIRDALGVQVAANWDEFAIDRPLDGRWIRYWLTPYSGPQSGTPFKDRLDDHPENLRAVEQDKREQLRLLYVGWTRARDRLVLAAMDGKLLNGLFSQLQEIDPTLICTPPADGAPVSWGGHSVTVPVRSASPQPAEPRSLTPGRMAVPAGPARHPPAVVLPSALTASGEIGEADQIGDRLRIRGDVNMSRVGNAVHGFLAADNPELAPEVRSEMATGLLSRWDVAGALDPDDLVRASEAFRAWCDRHWPGARRSNELSIYHRLENGSVVHGLIDVVLETDQESIIVDHKTFPGEIGDALALASGFAGQLSAYGAAINAAGGRPVGATYVHLPVLGRVIPVTVSDSTQSELNDG